MADSTLGTPTPYVNGTLASAEYMYEPISVLDTNITTLNSEKASKSNAEFSGTYLKLPVGTTNSRPTGSAGYIRFNTDESFIEAFNGTEWFTLPKNGTVVTDNSTNATRYLTFLSNYSGTLDQFYTSSTKLYFNPNTGTLNSTNFNSLSDVNFKENIEKIEDSVAIINQLEGVSFNWKDNGNKSYGLIAQELEKVLPELVSENDGVKSVNYDGLIPFLINAVKELSLRVEKLEKI